MSSRHFKSTDQVGLTAEQLQKSRPSIRGRQRRLNPAFALLVVGIVVALAVGFGMRDVAANDTGKTVGTLSELLAAGTRELTTIPVERMNLICAKGLSAEDPDIQQCAQTLRSWAERVRTETERHHYRFERNPAEFEGSPGFFRMLMLAVILSEDFGIHYDAQRRGGPAESSVADGFFASPANVFLHGLFGPGRQGTCSSLPVLYVAIGRQLGYPLKLVTTKGHLFVRWEGEGERFNVEVAGNGLNRFDDDYYRHWPFEVSSAEEAAEGYLRSLSSSEELAVFLSIRGMCLRESGRLVEAAESFAAAARLAPACASYRQVLAHLQASSGNTAQPPRKTQK